MAWGGLIDRYGSRMNIAGKDRPVTLFEGNTPLVPAPNLTQWIGGEIDLYLKYDGMNPTGSFKDRGMTTAITHARADGAEIVICASTGNTSAAAAAYAARAGMKCVVLIPDGKIAYGKLAGTLAYGAQVVAIHGSFDDGLRLVQEISAVTPIALVNSVNPARLEGQKTAAWEVCEQLGEIPDWLALPVGNAGNISAYWLGFSQCWRSECPVLCNRPPLKRPQLLGTQAAGAAPLVDGHPIDHPETKCTAIRIGRPARGDQALAAIRESNGIITKCSDDEIFAAYREVARLEGVFCEPSSAAGLAGLKQQIAAGQGPQPGQKVVAVLTGHGLKDPDSAVAEAVAPVTLDADLDTLKRFLLK
jgi:threonine synthase